MRNPVVLIREAADVTVRGFAEEAGVAQSTVQELEWGFYTRIPRELNKAIGKMAYDFGVDFMEIMAPHTSLNDAYIAWQHEERKKMWIAHNAPLAGTETFSPFKAFRQYLSGSDLKAFCRDLKVPRETVRRYEIGTTATIPRVIEQVLSEINYPYLTELKALQDDWRTKWTSTN